MNDELKKYIKEHQEQLPEFSPVDGHEDRFLQRLQAEQGSGSGKSKGVENLRWIAIAASLAILVSLGITVWQLRTVPEQQMAEEKMQLQQVSPEMKSAEEFLMAELNTKKQRADEIVASDPELQGFIDQLNQLEKDYEQLELELNTNRDNERIIAGMIQNYRLRLELLERLFAKHQTKKRLEEQHS